MSTVDTRFDSEEREQLLAEVRDHLPAFLSKAATEQPDPAGDVCDLLHLERADLDRVVSVHVCLTEPIRALYASLQRGLRHPISSSDRPPEMTQAVRGAIDWGATITARTRGGDRSVFVTRPAQRVFDTPENRALAWLLGALGTQLRRAAPREAEGDDAEEAGWDAELSSQRRQLTRVHRYQWLRSVPAERPDSRAMALLAAARSGFYSRVIPDAIDTLDHLTRSPSPADLTDLLCGRFFRPREDWRLFEVVVALRLARAFAERSPRRRSRLLVRGGPGPYAVYELDRGTEIRLHYQRWPATAGGSVHAATRDRHGLRGGDPTPDIVIERTGDRQDAVVIELKASRRAAYLGEGLSQLLGYLKDRPDLWRRQPSGWLVAPRSKAFQPRASSNEHDLWLVDADRVAAAAVARLAPAGE